MRGYLRNREGTEAAIAQDGWLKTGDCLTRDSEGFFTVVDRIKELIKYKVCTPAAGSKLPQG
jgi:4-coumarate--CoA ligase